MVFEEYMWLWVCALYDRVDAVGTAVGSYVVIIKYIVPLSCCVKYLHCSVL